MRKLLTKVSKGINLILTEGECQLDSSGNLRTLGNRLRTVRRESRDDGRAHKGDF